MIKTAEYARRGHPDRVADIIADAILDEFLKQDSDSRVAIEVFGSHGILTIGGEITTKGYVDVAKVATDVYKGLGYTDDIGVQVNVIEQSLEINRLANKGAGDSGIVTGYATIETEEMLPLEVVLAKKIADKFDSNIYMMPDGKIQISIDDYKKKITDIVISYQTDNLAYIDDNKIIKDMVNREIGDYISRNTKWYFTQFEIGGFYADTGLTGRKNVLWYGPRIPIGGGAFAGKDATKVDRSGAYLARNIAIKALKDFALKDCLVEIAYVIGEKYPLYIKINDKLLEFDEKEYELGNVINKFDLKKPIYKQASLFGHFGNKQFNWER